MTDICRMRNWKTPVRTVASIGLLGYLAAFYFLGPSAQKTLFYLAVALPGCLLLPDLARVLQQDKQGAVKSFLFVVSYYALSALWSEKGELLDGVKRSASLVCLMLAISSGAKLQPNAANWTRRFMLAIGAVAITYYCTALGMNIASSSIDLPQLLAQRHSLREIGGIGDSNPINGAIYLGVVILAAWWVFPHCPPIEKLGLLALIACGTGLMFLTQSRGPFLSLGATLSLIVITRRHRDDLVAAAFVLAAGVAAVVLLELLPTITGRITAPNYRLDIWSHAIGLIKENPYFGQGLGTSAEIPVVSHGRDFVVGHSHSSILETFRVGGITGGLAFLVMIFCNLRTTVQASDERRFFLFWLLFGTLCLSTNGRLPIIRPSVEWFAFWIPMFLASLTHATTTTNATLGRSQANRR
jgi:O-antigen ligase